MYSFVIIIIIIIKKKKSKKLKTEMTSSVSRKQIKTDTQEVKNDTQEVKNERLLIIWTGQENVRIFAKYLPSTKRQTDKQI